MSGPGTAIVAVVMRDRLLGFAVCGIVCLVGLIVAAIGFLSSETCLPFACEPKPVSGGALLVAAAGLAIVAAAPFLGSRVSRRPRWAVWGAAGLGAALIVAVPYALVADDLLAAGGFAAAVAAAVAIRCDSRTAVRARVVALVVIGLVGAILPTGVGSALVALPAVAVVDAATRA